MSSSGPLPQLPPTASAPHAVSEATACSGLTPIIVWPRVSKVIVVMSAIPGDDAPDALDGGLDLAQVGHRLDPDQVDPARHEGGGLLGEDVDRLVVVERAGRGEDRAARTDVARDERVAAGRVDLAAQEDRRGLVELRDTVLQPVQAEAHAVATERVGHEDLRPGVEVAAVDAPDDVGLGQVPDLGRVTEQQAVGEQHRAHRAVGDDRPVRRDELAPARTRGPAIGPQALRRGPGTRPDRTAPVRPTGSGGPVSVSCWRPSRRCHGDECSATSVPSGACRPSGVRVIDPLHGLVILAAGVAAGTINTIVGSGSLITFPTLLALGYPPLVANVSNTIGLVPGSLSGSIGYRRELAGQRARARPLLVAAGLGGLTGAALLLVLPAAAFARIVPVLILVATGLVAVQPRLTAWVVARRARLGHETPHGGGPLLVIGVYLTSIYGGYFGAGQGIILIALLAILVDDELQRLNGLKNVIATVVNAVAAIIFIALAPVAWEVAILLAIGSTIGGQLGASVGRRLPTRVLRLTIVVVGTVVAVRLLAG